MNSLYSSGARLTKQLQDHCEGYDNFFSWISYIADPPRFAVVIYPIAFSLHQPLGIRILLAASCSAFINVTIKWILNEHRPFWYVKAHKELGVQLAQTPQTCETGPGSPSGHVMIILGLLMGFAIGSLMTPLDVDAWKMGEYAIVSGVISLTCVSIYFGWMALGIDPRESTKLALDACDDPSYVNVSTNPLYGMMRNLACPLGLGYALSRAKAAKILEGARRAPVWARILVGFAGVAVGGLILCLPKPKNKILLYAGAVVEFFIFSFTVGYVFPYVLYRNYMPVNPSMAAPKKQSFSPEG
ncbi:glucose-6-phosphatase 3 [Ixodes scapularis]|uniref:glucose-6-phosphatase 3 n=1 Tax=Ixodes scapularis TaxID=6945 RepID=UPI001C3888AB|nr:glucose-6-phosphatase 3 [Ixodes scapularis]